MDVVLCNKYIMCVSESGSLTKAAKKLGVSQPALSSAISNMEKKLNFKIFNRKSIPIGLTPEGEVYLEYLHKLKQIEVDYQRKIDDIYDAASNKLVIGGPAVYVKSLIAESVVKLRKEYPRCNIIIKEASVPELIELSRNGEIDCFVSTSDDLPDGFEVHKIKEEKIYLCIPKIWEVNARLEEYRISIGEIGTKFDYGILNGLDFIFLESNQPLQIKMEKFLSENCIVPRNNIVVNQVSTGLVLSAMGEGIVFASEEALMSSGYTDALCVYMLPENISDRMIYIAYDSTHFMPYICQKVLEILSNEL